MDDVDMDSVVVLSNISRYEKMLITTCRELESQGALSMLPPSVEQWWLNEVKGEIRSVLDSIEGE